MQVISWRRPGAAGLMLAALLAATLAGCAGQVRPPTVDRASISAADRAQAIRILRTRLATAQRIFRLGERMMFSGVPLCGTDVRPAIGLALWNAHSGGRLPPAVMTEAFGLTDQVVVQEVGDRSPAARAGLRRGDGIVSIGGTPVPAGKESVAVISRQLRQLNQARTPYLIAYRRDGRVRRARVTPRPRCNYAYGVVRAGAVNAFADGRRVVVTTGLMRFANSDAELAVVFGHELAHNTLGHVGRTRATSIIGSVGGTIADLALGVIGIPTFGIFSTLGGTAGRTAFSVGYEREADYVGLYFAALAGYRLEGALDIWRRLAEQSPSRRRLLRTHPSYAERFVAMRKTVAEISAKRAAGQPLRPNRSSGGEGRFEPVEK